MMQTHNHLCIYTSFQFHTLISRTHTATMFIFICILSERHRQHLQCHPHTNITAKTRPPSHPSHVTSASTRHPHPRHVSARSHWMVLVNNVSETYGGHPNPLSRDGRSRGKAQGTPEVPFKSLRARKRERMEPRSMCDTNPETQDTATSNHIRFTE